MLTNKWGCRSCVDTALISTAVDSYLPDTLSSCCPCYLQTCSAARLHEAFLRLLHSPEAALTAHSPCKEGHEQVRAGCHRSQGQSTALLGQFGCQQGVARLSRSHGCPSGRTTEEATWPRGKPPVPLAVQEHRRRKHHQFSSLCLRKDADSISQHSGDTLT